MTSDAETAEARSQLAAAVERANFWRGEASEAIRQLRVLSGIAVPKSAWDEVNDRAEAAEAIIDRLETELEILPCYATDTPHAPHLVRLPIIEGHPLLFVCPGVASPTPTGPQPGDRSGDADD